MKNKTQASYKLLNRILSCEKHIQEEFTSYALTNYPHCILPFSKSTMLGIVGALTLEECEKALIWIEQRTAA